MIRKNKKALAVSLADMHLNQAVHCWDVFRNSETLNSLEDAEIISPEEARIIALDAMYLALNKTSND
jgi:hypothetical protein